MDTRSGFLSHGGCFQGGNALGTSQALQSVPALCTSSMCIPVMCACKGPVDLLLFTSLSLWWLLGRCKGGKKRILKN